MSQLNVDTLGAQTGSLISLASNEFANFGIMQVASWGPLSGASNQLEICVSSVCDPVINAAGGDTQIKDAGNNICVVRSDGFEMYQGIYLHMNV